MPILKPVRCQVLVIFRQVTDRQPQVVGVVEERHEISRLGKAHPCQPRLSGGALDVLEHAIEDGPSEVRLGVGEPLGVVGSSRLGQGQISLTLQVIDQYTTLPMGAVLYEVPCEDTDKLQVVSDQGLLFGG